MTRNTRNLEYIETAKQTMLLVIGHINVLRTERDALHKNNELIIDTMWKFKINCHTQALSKMSQIIANWDSDLGIEIFAGHMYRCMKMIRYGLSMLEYGMEDSDVEYCIHAFDLIAKMLKYHKKFAETYLELAKFYNEEKQNTKPILQG